MATIFRTATLTVLGVMLLLLMNGCTSAAPASLEIETITLTNVSGTVEPTVVAMGDTFLGMTPVDFWASQCEETAERHYHATLQARLTLRGTLASTGEKLSYLFLVDEEHWPQLPSFGTDKPQPYAIEIFDFTSALMGLDSGATLFENLWTAGAFCGARAVIRVSLVFVSTEPYVPIVVAGGFAALRMSDN